MTQEHKQLLLKDLCARLPYGIKCCARYNTGSRYNTNIVTIIPENGSIVTRQNELHYQKSSLIEDCRPYLRPMSSMTEDEREEIEVFIFNEWYQENSCKIDKEGWIEILANYDVSGIDPCFCSDYIDWLNAHHFDYRGLIEKSLAIVAPEGMYKYEND